MKTRNTGTRSNGVRAGLGLATSSSEPRRGGGGVGASVDAESMRLREADANIAPWRRWGPYLSERQWGTVREDYSHDGDCWNSFPHDHARSRAYRWGEDGLLGFCDDGCRLCFAPALWNGHDPILKERLFGLTGPEGNHGEDVKEEYFYLDGTPTHSYMRALYKYPQAAFPYARLVEENRRRGRNEREFELRDTGVFDDGRYFDVQVEYAKAAPDDILIRLTVTNRAERAAPLHLLPTLWFRNTWSWGLPGADGEHAARRPQLRDAGDARILASDPVLGEWELVTVGAAGAGIERLFTENESNAERLWGVPNRVRFVKDAFHARVIAGDVDAVNPARSGTKAAVWHMLDVPARGTVTLRLRLRRVVRKAGEETESVDGFDAVMAQRRVEADEFYDAEPRRHHRLSPEARRVARQAAAGLLWSKQFYEYDVRAWLSGDPAQPTPPASRRMGRNAGWEHLNNRDIISMPDKWEYPWYAAWDLAFHAIPLARLDPRFAKDQLVLMLREWYMHPNGQIPAYEFALGDVNPPVHAWAVWRVYKMTAARGERDAVFLARCFQKLLLNFTWWVNRKDPAGRNLFAGGFLGLDNIGAFDRSRALPTGGHMEQADGTAWMAFYCGTMLSMALELASSDPAYEDVATKFFEHFVAISDAMNTLGGSGLWDERDGFYYDQIRTNNGVVPLRVRSLVGVVPLLAVEVLDETVLDRLPDFKARLEWFLRSRSDVPWHAACACAHGGGGEAADAAGGVRLLAIPSRDRLERVVQRLLDEDEFLSPFGVRSMSRAHAREPFTFRAAGEEFRVDYTPGESTTGLFGGNSNWRGPVWFPLNFLLIEALERYDRFYGETLSVEMPTRSGRRVSLREAANELRHRLARLFLPDRHGRRPCHGGDDRFAGDPHWKELLCFHEHFDGDTGRGLGATHQTGWTALVMLMLDRAREADRHEPEGVVAQAGRAPARRGPRARA